MIDKIKGILESVRFWQVTLAAIVQVLAYFGVLAPELANIITGWLGVVITIGSVDSFAMKLGRKK